MYYFNYTIQFKLALATENQMLITFFWFVKIHNNYNKCKLNGSNYVWYYIFTHEWVHEFMVN